MFTPSEETMVLNPEKNPSEPLAFCLIPVAQHTHFSLKPLFFPGLVRKPEDRPVDERGDTVMDRADQFGHHDQQCTQGVFCQHFRISIGKTLNVQAPIYCSR